MELILPKKYDPRLTIRETQDAIKYIRDTFQKEMGRELHLERISAPLFVEQSSGLNDNLNGVERPVQFDMAGLPGETCPFTGQMEAHCLKGIRLSAGRRSLYQYERHPQG